MFIMGCKQSKQICVASQLDKELKRLELKRLEAEDIRKGEHQIPTAPPEEDRFVESEDIRNGKHQIPTAPPEEDRFVESEDPPAYSLNTDNFQASTSSQKITEDNNNVTIINNYNVYNVESYGDVEDSSNSKYVVTIYTVLNKQITVFINEPDITIGELLVSLLEDYKYKYQVANVERSPPQHLFLASEDDYNTIEYDLFKPIKFINKHAEYYMKIDREYYNYEDGLIEKVLKEKKRHREILQDVKQNIRGKNITVNITSLSGKKIPIQINTHDTVQKLKELYYDKVELEPQFQTLKIVNRELKDHEFIKEHDINDGQRIICIVKIEGVRIHESSGHSGHNVPIKKSCFNLNRSNRKKPGIPREIKDDNGETIYIYQNRNITGKNITVNIMSLTGQKTPIQINTHDTVQKLKELYSNKLGFIPKLKTVNEVLKDNKLIKEYNIDDGQKIYCMTLF